MLGVTAETVRSVLPRKGPRDADAPASRVAGKERVKSKAPRLCACAICTLMQDWPVRGMVDVDAVKLTVELTLVGPGLDVGPPPPPPPPPGPGFWGGVHGSLTHTGVLGVGVAVGDGVTVCVVVAVGDGVTVGVCVTVGVVVAEDVAVAVGVTVAQNCSPRRDRSFSATRFKTVGIHPLNRLLLRYTLCRLESLPSVAGMLPVSWLLLRTNPCSLERLPNSAGILPDSWLWLRLNPRRLERLPSSLGILPDSWLWASCNAVRFVRLPNAAGMLPVSWLR